MSDFDNFNQQMIDQFRQNGGRLDFGAARLLLLTHRGAKSGREYVSPLAAFDDDGRVYIVASKGGSPTNPAWFHNLVANPKVSVEFDGDRYEARARVLSDKERDALYPRIVERMPQFGEYQQNTARTIPVIELERL